MRTRPSKIADTLSLGPQPNVKLRYVMGFIQILRKSSKGVLAE